MPVLMFGGLADLVDSKPLFPSSLPLEMQIPEFSNTPSSSSRISRASLIFLMLISSIVFSIFSDAYYNQLAFYMSMEACFSFKAAGVGVTFSD